MTENGVKRKGFIIGVYKQFFDEQKNILKDDEQVFEDVFNGWAPSV